jgi:hypothetical protein
VQLDKTRITIRERSYAELLDSALRVTATHFFPLAAALLAGVVPIALFNAWLLWDLRNADFDWGFPLTYMVFIACLTAIERPLATAALTIYLGKAMFDQRPSRREIVGDLRQCLGRLLVVQGLFRIAFLLRPFANQVLLLERNPLSSRDPAMPSFRKRVKRFHADNGNEVSRALLLEWPIEGVMIAVCLVCLASNIAILSNNFEWDRAYCTVAFPAVLWCVVGFFEVARFLEYLDIRIRREGWEVELLLRAERDRLVRRLT